MNPHAFLKGGLEDPLLQFAQSTRQSGDPPEKPEATPRRLETPCFRFLMGTPPTISVNVNGHTLRRNEEKPERERVPEGGGGPVSIGILRYIHGGGEGGLKL